MSRNKISGMVGHSSYLKADASRTVLLSLISMEFYAVPYICAFRFNTMVLHHPLLGNCWPQKYFDANFSTQNLRLKLNISSWQCQSVWIGRNGSVGDIKLTQETKTWSSFCHVIIVIDLPTQLRPAVETIWEFCNLLRALPNRTEHSRTGRYLNRKNGTVLENLKPRTGSLIVGGSDG